MFLSNSETNIRNTIFMGPLSHRETTVDAYLNQKKGAKWSEEAENEYLESVKSRAAEKVRALLLQAKRRSDEIIQDAETHAKEITAQAEQKAGDIEQKAQSTLINAEQRFQDVYNEAVQKAQNDLNQILAQNQQALGESTAVVLLSIHEQLNKFYDVWKEDLKQLTLDAIEVGTGWVASTEKEAILKQLLDESVQKLIDKKNFIVRVNPADAELITQVLENSREQAWRMESSKELEAGSLELESDNVFIKNSHSERQKFVQEILDNLILPKNQDEERLEQQLKNTLDHEMQNNPVLRHSMEQNPEPITEIPLQNIMPAAEEAIQENIANTIDMQEIAFEQPAAQRTEQPAEDVSEGLTQELLGEALAQEMPKQAEPAPQPAPQTAPQPAPQPKQAAPSQTDIDDLFDSSAPQPAPLAQQTAPSQADIDDLFDSPQAAEEPKQAAPSQADIDNLFDSPAPQSSPQAQPPKSSAQADIDNLFDNETQVPHEIHAEAQDLVEEFLGQPKSAPEQEQGHALPNDLADDLLAEMGFNDKH